MFYLNYGRVITYKGASLTVDDEMLYKVASLLNMSVDEIRTITEKHFPSEAIHKSVTSEKSSDGLQTRLKQLTTGK